MKSLLLAGIATLALAAGPTATPAQAQVVVSANDAKVTLVNGVATLVANPVPDSITVMDIVGGQVRVRGQAPVAASVVGPPLSVAVSPDNKLAVVTANQVVDPNDATKTVAGTFMTLVDISGTGNPVVLGRVPTGPAPAGLSFTPDGKLLLVAHRGDGSVWVYRVVGQTVTELAKLSLGNAASLVSHVAVTPDGKFALVSRNGDHRISVLAINGETVTNTPRQLTPGLAPYAVNITPDGKWAVSANMGTGQGDTDTVSLIDLQRQPFRVVDSIAVGQTPEGMQVSPDNRHVAVTVMNGSNKATESPFRGPGQLRLLRIENGRLRIVSTATIGTWAQGVAFSRDGRTVLAGNMIEHTIQVFRIDDTGGLSDTGRPVRVFGGSVALRSGR